MKLYTPFVSKSKNKKYSVYVVHDGKPRLIHFGDSRYGQYYDKLKHYGAQDHRDEKRRELYYQRHGLTDDINTAKWWSHHVLW